MCLFGVAVAVGKLVTLEVISKGAGSNTSDIKWGEGIMKQEVLSEEVDDGKGG